MNKLLKNKHIFLLLGLIVLSLPEAFSQSSGDFINTLLQKDFVDSITAVAINKVETVAWTIAMVIFGLTFAFGYLSGAVKTLLGSEGGAYFDREGLFYAIFIMVLLGAYGSIATTLSDGVDYINGITELDAPSKFNLEKAADAGYSDEQIEALIYVANGGNNIDPKLQEGAIRSLDHLGIDGDAYIQNAELKTDLLVEQAWYEKLVYYTNPRNWITMIFYGMGKSITFIVRGAVLLFTYFYFKAILILGPIAFAFAINPRWKDLISEWLGAVLHTGLVFTTINILDYFYSQVFEARMQHGEMTVQAAMDVGNGTAYTSEILVNLGFIILYLSAFKITKIFVPGKGMGANMVGKAIGLGAAAVGGLIMGAGGAMGMAGGSSGGANAMKQAASVANKTASAYKEEE